MTKRYLVLVCKKWNVLASQYLYESILINKVGSSQKLHHTLNDSKNKPGPFLALGECTKRIDITLAAFRDHINGSEITGELECLPSVFQHLPNLTIISFSVLFPRHFDIPSPKNILSSIAGSCGPRLEAITWYTHRMLPPTKADWLAFLTATPNIRSIRCSTLPFLERKHSVSTQAEGQNPPRLSMLQQLYIPIIIEPGIDDEDENYFPLDDLPSLRRLTIEARDFGQPTYESTILKRYGCTLETLQLAIFLPHCFQRNISIVSEACPNLSRLDLSFIHFQGMQLTPLPQTIETLGIQCGWPRTGEHTFLSLFDILWRMGESHKRLKVIQFLDPANVRDLHERHQQKVVAAAERLTRNLGIELHDHTGHPMH